MLVFKDLPEVVRLQILNRLDFATRRTIVSLVCKEWNNFSESTPGVWASVSLSEVEEEAAFRLLSSANLTGGLTLNGNETLSIKRQKVMTWFRELAKHSAITTVAIKQVAAFSTPLC